MTPIEAMLRRRIAQTGPVTLHDYMALCLGHPEHGYYATRDPFGAAGDFTTAPEISQMFGELVGLALAQAWLDQGRPAPFRLVELGPGRGTLIADALRAAGAVPGFRDAADLQLVETSPALRAEQAKRVSAHWAERLEDTSEGPLFLIANEFFDALPIRQYLRRDGQWFERVVTVAEDRLAYGLARSALPLPAAPEGAVRERSPGGEAVAGLIGARIAREGGAALIIDYGYAETPPLGGDTFQAVRAHGATDPLEAPGEADLTAHVDFAALAETARREGAAATRPVGQGAWLARLGIGARAEALAKTAGAEPIASALHRLTDPADMGTLFKALAIHPAGAPPPPGFEAA